MVDRFGLGGMVIRVLLAALAFAARAEADSAAEIDRAAGSALRSLCATNPAAAQLEKAAKAILVFPRIIKGGFLVGGQYGEGALRRGGKTSGYYSSVAASYGLQAGVQAFGYAMFFMTEDAIKYLDRSSGWEIGVGPSIVVIDEGMARSFSTTSAKEDIYVFFFSQKGLMAGLGLQGSKITRIYPR